MLNLQLLAQDAGVVEHAPTLVDRLDGDVLSAAVILGVIGTVVIVVTVVCSVTSMIQNIAATRMAYNMINDLSKRGYSAEEVERLVYGDKNLSRKVKQAFRRVKGRVASSLAGQPEMPAGRHASPPMK